MILRPFCFEHESLRPSVHECLLSRLRIGQVRNYQSGESDGSLEERHRGWGEGRELLIFLDSSLPSRFLPETVVSIASGEGQHPLGCPTFH